VGELFGAHGIAAKRGGAVADSTLAYASRGTPAPDRTATLAWPLGWAWWFEKEREASKQTRSPLLPGRHAHARLSRSGCSMKQRPSAPARLNPGRHWRSTVALSSCLVDVTKERPYHHKERTAAKCCLLLGERGKVAELKRVPSAPAYAATPPAGQSRAPQGSRKSGTELPQGRHGSRRRAAGGGRRRSKPSRAGGDYDARSVSRSPRWVAGPSCGVTLSKTATIGSTGHVCRWGCREEGKGGARTTHPL